MFESRDLSEELATVRAEEVGDALVLDCERDFDRLSAPHLDDLGSLVDRLDPDSYSMEWVPGDAPGLLARIAGPDLVIGLPEHGGVTWTRQTDPPVVLVRPRTRGSDSGFLEFLIAEAFVTLGRDFPEHFLGFFEERYRSLSALDVSPAEAYQLAAALYAGYRGLYTREAFEGWEDQHDRLHGAWREAGERLEPRLDDLPRELAMEETAFADGAELACSAIKHGLDVPAPFAALDTAAYREHGADFALRWAEKVLE